jgi:hypothetical protein
LVVGHLNDSLMVFDHHPLADHHASAALIDHRPLVVHHDPTAPAGRPAHDRYGQSYWFVHALSDGRHDPVALVDHYLVAYHCRLAVAAVQLLPAQRPPLVHDLMTALMQLPQTRP